MSVATRRYVLESGNLIVNAADGISVLTLLLQEGNLTLPHFLSVPANRAMLKKYGDDVAKFFVVKFKKISQQEEISAEDKKKLQSLLNEFFRVKALLAGEDEP